MDSADPNSQLLGAAQQDSIELFETAMKRKCNINYVDGVHNTAVHYACQCGSLLVLEQILLKMTENLVYLKNVQGNTPLHCALDSKWSNEKKSSMVTLLLKHNPLLLSRNKSGMTPIDMASGSIKEQLQAIAASSQARKSPKKTNLNFFDKKDVDNDNDDE